MVTEMTVSCYDIKPENCVIKHVTTREPIVRFIDWDTDFCQDTLLAKKREGNIANGIIILHVIMMANHFYHYFDT